MQAVKTRARVIVTEDEFKTRCLFEAFDVDDEKREIRFSVSQFAETAARILGFSSPEIRNLFDPMPPIIWNVEIQLFYRKLGWNNNELETIRPYFHKNRKIRNLISTVDVVKRSQRHIPRR